MKFTFSTSKHDYHVTLKWNYVGAIAVCKMPRDGEDWLRGNDLRDGSLFALPKVVADIFAHANSVGRWRLV